MTSKKESPVEVSELIFHPDVEKEISASYRWYEDQAIGLGDDFLNELETAYQAIMQFPNTWPKFHISFRRYLLSKFPFSVIYRVKGESVLVIAVMHQSRKPCYWDDRQ